MLQDNNRIRLPLPYLIRHPLEDIDPALIIVPPVPGLIGKSLGKIKTEAINSILLHPKSTDTIHKLLSIYTLMIKIISPKIIGIRRGGIIPGIGGGGIPVRVLIHARSEEHTSELQSRGHL